MCSLFSVKGSGTFVKSISGSDLSSDNTLDIHDTLLEKGEAF